MAIIVVDCFAGVICASVLELRIGINLVRCLVIAGYTAGSHTLHGYMPDDVGSV